MPEKGARSNIYILAAAVAIIVILVAGGFVVFQMLSPAVWTETLKVKNSTGQFDVVTKYRNASDPGLVDFRAFRDTENATLKGLVDADETYRPVEYAITLHDDAQRARINCSLLPLDVAGDSPGHVVVAFNVKDTGMTYVDPTSTNVSATDFPGIRYDRIIFLRDQWNHTMPVTDERNASIRVREYRNAQPVSYSELLHFLATDDTEWNPGRDIATSADFAVRLHDNAEASGLLNAIVQADFVEEDYFCYFNAFPTTDKGIVYISDRNSSRRMSGR